ncbi:MAG: hypothetical protein COV44_01445 [Deltaproteobacteria bacterium CG11_big_fil_rev_8_21_14_0_20_45_16]|nr:MAG: hypothetical protein COV44_01445 [Deltaproteobacteria bacterium CG11_big_fil_rev_8_21_14_0_20_45_16]
MGHAKRRYNSKVFEKAWFKWASVGISLSFTLIVGLVFYGKEWMYQAETQQRQLKKEKTLADYEEKFRNTMVRIYQNLQLKHHLAAYNLYKELPPPPEILPNQYREYYETMERVARGLIDDEFFDESEELFEKLLHTDGYEDVARASIDKVGSHRRLESALRLLESARHLIETARYRDGANEIKKAKLEFESVRLFKLQNVDREMEELERLNRISKHFVHLDEAKWRLEDAEKLMKAKRYTEVQATMTAAADHVGRAAFFNPNSTDVAEIRQRLFDLDADLAYIVPNLIPMWNLERESELDSQNDYFFMTGYEFNLKDIQANKIDIALKFKMRARSTPYYVVRYKIYYFNGLSFFNGHFVTPKTQEKPTKEREIVFDQEIPEDYRGLPVKRIDLKVYDSANRIVSRVNRAFRRPT